MAANTPARSKSRSRSRGAANRRRRTRGRSSTGQQRTRKTSSRGKSQPRRQTRRRRTGDASATESSTTIVIKVTPSVRQQWRNLSARWKDILPKLRNGETLKESLARMRKVARRIVRSKSADGATGVANAPLETARNDTATGERRTRVSIKYPG